MLRANDPAPGFALPLLDEQTWQLSRGRPTLLLFFETDCPTCRLTLPYLNRLARHLGENAAVIGISQDSETLTREIVEQTPITFPVALDRDLRVSRLYDPFAVPTLFLLDRGGKVVKSQIAFDKRELNSIAAALCEEAGIAPFMLADRFDGNPDCKPGCTSRHLEAGTELAAESPAIDLYPNRGSRASRVELSDDSDPYEYCLRSGFGDSLPVVPPTVERVESMLIATALAPEEVVGLVPPNYGAATIEKIAANGVMAGCAPEMMRVLIPLVRAACDERFNLHGVQATTHFAAPLVIVNGPVRDQLGFACRSNVFSNVARANSSLGRALQLIMVNLGGARPGEIDMSTLGNPGKFSYCIAENEEENPWEPLHVEMGFRRDQSAVSLFAAEPPKGVSEHNARDGSAVLKAISRALAISWSYRVCAMIEAIVVLCPEHVKTLQRDGFTKGDVRRFLFENTGIPVRHFADEGEGTQYVKFYTESVIDGEPCYLKFREPGQIKIVVAGGTAGKFSAVISSWATGPRGSQMVTYPIVDSE
jgi:peroxiredoxin